MTCDIILATGLSISGCAFIYAYIYIHINFNLNEKTKCLNFISSAGLFDLHVWHIFSKMLSSETQKKNF